MLLKEISKQTKHITSIYGNFIMYFHLITLLTYCRLNLLLILVVKTIKFTQMFLK